MVCVLVLPTPSHTPSTHVGREVPEGHRTRLGACASSLGPSGQEGMPRTFPPPHPRCVHLSTLCICISVPILELGSSAPVFLLCSFFLDSLYLESSTHFPVLVFKMLTSPSITPTPSLENTQLCACMKHCMSACAVAGRALLF